MKPLVLFLLALLGLTGCCTKPEQIAPGPRTNPLYLVSHGWHTGLILPARSLQKAVPQLAQRFGRPAFYEIGWGDRDFYRARKIQPEMAVKALFFAEGSILHVVAVPKSPRESFRTAEIHGTRVSDAELESITHFVAASFLKDNTFRPIDLGRGIYGDSQFYDGAGRYSMFHTCNTWTAKGLKVAGTKISPAGKLTSGSVLAAVKKDRAWSPVGWDGTPVPVPQPRW